MSVNLKLRKSAQSEQEAPAPELVMAGGQTPWGPTPTTPPPSGNPFADANGMPTAPPPPPSFPPGEDPDADAPSARKVNPKLLAAAVAVVVALGGGYFYLNSGSSDSGASTTPNAAQVAAQKAKLAALRAKAAGKPAAGAAAGAGAGAAAKPTTAVKAGTPAKAPAKTPAKTPVKAVKPAKAPAKTPAKTPAKAPAKAPAAAVAGTVMHVALPGQIGVWPKLVITKAPKSLVKYDPSVGTTLSNLQVGYYGGTQQDPSAAVIVADHPAKDKLSAIKLLREQVAALRADGFVVANPEVVSDPLFAGNAACTTATRNDVLGVTCMWADAGTWGFLVVGHTADSQKIDILDTIRASVEH